MFFFLNQCQCCCTGRGTLHRCYHKTRHTGPIFWVVRDCHSCCSWRAVRSIARCTCIDSWCRWLWKKLMFPFALGIPKQFFTFKISVYQQASFNIFKMTFRSFSRCAKLLWNKLTRQFENELFWKRCTTAFFKSWNFFHTRFVLSAKMTVRNAFPIFDWQLDSYPQFLQTHFVVLFIQYNNEMLFFEQKIDYEPFCLGH